MNDNDGSGTLKDFDYEALDPLNRLLAEEAGNLPPMSPDGGFTPTLNLPTPIPEATPANMVCLRGPCRNYMQIESRFQHGNTQGTLDHEPRQQNRFCRAIPGTDIDLTDEVVFECSEWDPLLPAETLNRDNRRKEWLTNNPDYEVDDNG